MEVARSIRSLVPALAIAGAAACSDGEPSAPPLPDGSSSGAPVTADAGGEPPPPGEGIPVLDVTFACRRSYRLEARWAPVSAADRYVAELADGTRLAETTEPYLRIRQDNHFPVRIRALSGERKLAAAVFRSDHWAGDLVWLRGRRGTETTVEMVGCFTERLAAGGDSPLPSEVNPMLFPGGAPASMQQSASLVEIEPRLRSRLVFRGLDDAYVVDPADAFVTADIFDSVSVRPWGLRATAVVTHTAQDYVLDEAGDVRVGPHEGALVAWARATELAPRVARSLSIDADGGVWIVASGDDGGMLFHRASPTSTLEEAGALPDGAPGQTSSFDVVSGLFAEQSTGKLFQRTPPGDAGTGGWRDTGLVVPGLRSIRSADGYVFLTGGVDGDQVLVLDPAAFTVRGTYTLEGVSDLELFGYEPRRELGWPP